MSVNLVKNGTFLTGAEYWRSDHIMGAEGLYEPGVGAPSPGCIKLPVDNLLWQNIETITKGKFELRFRARGVEPIVSGDFVWLEVRFADDVFQAEYSATLPFGMEGRALGDWVDYSGIIELPNMNFVNVVFECIEADSSASLYIDAIELEPLPEVLCDGLIHELQKRRRDFSAAKHPEIRYRETVTQAVNDSPSSLWETEYIDIEAEVGQYWYQLDSAVKKPEHVKRLLVHRTVGTDTEEEIVGRWATEFGQDGHVYLHIDEAIYDGCMLRVEYAQYPGWPACEYATTLPIDREWVLCQATTLLLMEADPTLEPPDFIERDLRYWDAKRVAREAEIVPRPRTAKARTLPLSTYQEKAAPCGDADDIVGGPFYVPVPPTPTLPPVAAFHAEQTTSSYKPFDVQFRSDSEGSIVGWTWIFGDGERSNEEDPQHTYTEYGRYPVVLSVLDANGRSHTVTKSDYIIVGIPTANFEAVPEAGSDPWPVAFTDLSVGEITGWLWDFGDDETSTEQNPTHDYASTGDHTVTLTVTGPNGSDTSDPQVLPVGDPGWMPPVSEFHATPIQSSLLPVDVQFTYAGSGATSWAWTFGDGESSNDENPLHTYTTAEKFTVGLTVTNAYGNDLETKTDYIVTGIPDARFDTKDTWGTVPHTATFRNTSIGTITGYQWLFGDGYWSSKAEPTHTYEYADEFDVTLIADGPTGSSQRDRPKYIQVDPAPVPVPHAAFRADPIKGDNVPLDVTFTDESTGTNLVSWAWDFGDGATSTEQNPMHTYTSGGRFTVSLTVADELGQESTVTKENHIVIGEVNADFTGGPRTGVPRTVGFENLTTGIVESYLWEFGDGGTSDEFEPEYDYDTPGTYDVTLTVTGVVNDDEEKKLGYIEVSAHPAAVADFDPAAGTIGKGEVRISLVNKSENAETYAWDFDYLANPGVDLSTEKDPVKTFYNDTDPQVTRNWTVRLVATGPGGNDNKEKIYSVTVWDPAVADFDADVRRGPKSLTVNFRNLSTNSVSWLWDFDFVGSPGANTSTERDPTFIYQNAGKYTVKLTATPPEAGTPGTKTETDYIEVTEAPPTGRVTDGLMALYEFSENGGAIVTDTSGEGTALNLVIESQDQVTWGADGYLTVNDNVVIASTNPASKIISACKTSDEITLEAWVIRGATPEDTNEHWIMGIMSTETAWFRNCAMGEVPEDDQLVSMMRTVNSANIGDKQSSDTGALKSTLIHLVVTRAADGTVKMYQNAVEIKSLAGDAGAFSNWDDTYRLVLANHHNGSRPWLGTLYLVAVYDKALTADEVSQNFMIKENGTPPPTDEPDFWVSNGSRRDIPTGNDDWEGSETHPWLTLGFAVEQLVPGDTLGVMGTYHETVNLNTMAQDGQENNRICILGIDTAGGKACVDGEYSLPPGDWAGEPDWECNGTKFTYSALVKVGKESAGKGSYTTLENIIVMQSRGRGVNVEYVTGFHLIDVDVKETRAGAIRFDQGEDNLIRDTTTLHSMNYCPKQRGPKPPWAHSIVAMYQTNLQVESCTATRSYGEGMGMHNCTDSAFVDCISRNSNNTGISVNAGINSKIVRCFVAFDETLLPGCGISISGEDTGGYTSMKRDTDGVLVANNIIYGASPGIRIRNASETWGQKNISIYHNTVVHVRVPKLNPEKWPYGVSILIRSPNSTTGYVSVDIRNNLCLGTLSTDGSQMAYIASMAQKWLDAITFSHNWWSHLPDETKATSAEDKIDGPGVKETDLSPTRQPEDGQVLSGNKGINAGKNLLAAIRAVIDDYWETERPTNPTMGAHEPE